VLAEHRERLSVLFEQTLDVIEDALEARKIFLVKGVVVDGGPDHYLRLEAVLYRHQDRRRRATARRVPVLGKARSERARHAYAYRGSCSSRTASG